MIYLILKSYIPLILSVGFFALMLLMMGFYFIFKKISIRKMAETKEEKNSAVIHCYPEKEKPKVESKENELPVFIEEEPTLIDFFSLHPVDIKAIAGEDLFTTQLDLARAYIEIGNQLFAKKILEEVVVQGSVTQQNEARKLLGLM